MVHYIRFLRVPHIQLESKGQVARISAVLTVTTDLGESYYPEDLELIVHLVNTEQPGPVVSLWRVFWRKNTQVTKLDLRHRSSMSSKLMRLHISTRETDESWAKNIQIPKILDVWSDGFFLNADCSALDYVERKLRLTNTTSINIREATGESIARHIWDGALGCLELYKHTLLLKDAVTMLPQFHQLLMIGEACKKIKAVELGSGCGVAGIALAQIVPGSRVLLTDLEAAQDIITLNIKSTSLPKGSSLHQEVLDWNEPLSGKEPHQNVDLLVVCECIYNADSCPTLISILQQFIAMSPSVKILVITKRRHDSERVFFDLMGEAGIQMLEQCFVPLPHHASDAEPETPQAEIYLYGAFQGAISSKKPLNGNEEPLPENGNTLARLNTRIRKRKAKRSD